jgi:hypothetical protein
MGTIVKYPQRLHTVRDERSIADQPRSATVIVLPVRQIQQDQKKPSDRDLAGSRSLLSRNSRQRAAPRVSECARFGKETAAERVDR